VARKSEKSQMRRQASVLSLCQIGGGEAKLEGKSGERRSDVTGGPLEPSRQKRTSTKRGQKPRSPLEEVWAREGKLVLRPFQRLHTTKRQVTV